MDNDALQEKLTKSEWKVERFIVIAGQMQKEATQLKQELSDVRIQASVAYVNSSVKY